LSRIVCIERLGNHQAEIGGIGWVGYELGKNGWWGGVMCLLNKEPNNFLVMSEQPISLDMFLDMLK